MSKIRHESLKKNLRTISIAMALAAAHPWGMAADGVSFEAATGNKTEIASIGAQWNWENRWFESNGTHIGGYWDATIAHWRGNRYQDMPGAHQHIASIGITPVFRLQNDNLKGIYVEAGIGAHRLSEHYDNDGRILSTDFQFGSRIGVGYVFQNNWEFGLSVQHFSNGGIKEPNSGVNFAAVRLRYQL